MMSKQPSSTTQRRLALCRMARLCMATAGLSLLISCGSNPTPINPAILAEVGDVVITVEDFQSEVGRRAQIGRPVRSKEALLEEMISEELLLQKARAAGLENDPDLQRNHRNMLLGLLRQKELTPKLEAAQIGPEEVEAYYQENLGQYTRPAKVRMAILHLKAPMDSPAVEAVRQRMSEAREAAARLPEGTRGFGPLAISHSEDQVTRYKGGDIGWIEVGREQYSWPREVIQAGIALNHPRDLSEVVQTEAGLYLVMKLDSRGAVLTGLDQVEAGIRRRMLAAKRQQMEADYLTQIRQTGPVRWHAESLATLKLPAAVLARTQQIKPPAFP